MFGSTGYFRYGNVVRAQLRKVKTGFIWAMLASKTKLSISVTTPREDFCHPLRRLFRNAFS
jgi:hypothetical protein